MCQGPDLFLCQGPDLFCAKDQTCSGTGAKDRTCLYAKDQTYLSRVETSLVLGTQPDLLSLVLGTGTDAKDQTCFGTHAKDQTYFFRAFFSFRATPITDKSDPRHRDGCHGPRIKK